MFAAASPAFGAFICVHMFCGYLTLVSNTKLYRLLERGNRANQGNRTRRYSAALPDTELILNEKGHSVPTEPRETPPRDTYHAAEYPHVSLDPAPVLSL